MPSTPPTAPLRFGAYSFDHATRLVTRDGAPIHLTPKAFALLSLLIAEAPRVVPKEELHRRIWPDTFVSDASLLGLIKEVRAALRDESNGGLIRTVHRVGYAFAAPLQPVAAQSPGSIAWVMAGPVCLPLGEGENLIGRDADCAVRVDLPNVSRRHARIVVTGASAVLEDLGSTNGTVLNEAAIDRPVALRNTDRIRLGDAILTFHISLSTGANDTLPTGTPDA